MILFRISYITRILLRTREVKCPCCDHSLSWYYTYLQHGQNGILLSSIKFWTKVEPMSTTEMLSIQTFLGSSLLAWQCPKYRWSMVIPSGNNKLKESKNHIEKVCAAEGCALSCPTASQSSAERECQKECHIKCRLPYKLQGIISRRMSNICQNARKMSEYMSGRTPDRTSDRMPDQMPLRNAV